MKVSIIISNRNDIAMLVVTIRSCIEELRPFAPGDAEIVIADNSDKGYWEALQGAIPSGYVREKLIKLCRQDFPCLFSARELAAKQAKGEYILCLDSHMIVGRDTIYDLVWFMDRHSDDPTLGFAHAPILWAHQHERAAKHDRDMSKHELGDWGLKHETESLMSWKGMPWICRREWFLDRDKGLNGYGALAEHRVSWGGGDMHIGIKPWLLGFKNWAVPSNPCIHIGPFPKDRQGSEVIVGKGIERYRQYSESGKYPHTFGFLVSCYVLGGEAMMRRNEKMIKDRFGRYLDVDKYWSKAIELGKNEHEWLRARRKMTFVELLRSKPWTKSEENSDDGSRDLQTLSLQNAGSPILEAQPVG